ncbi:hypothetical protein NH287_13190 [Microbacterium sp. CnD16-F]|uniref:hypothetical protein n=2 Tax=Microbacterium TaxID=33882 RepID=UPI000C440EAA|nr:hypothetical protein [Microbacterium sp. CnD16-F]MBU21286.1 hypothetical protein [Microbacterium sp.]MCO7204440.1 hypothetical protein [Microbacterium sp. CnD16-F]HBS07184.1 hypothetical protein [Microbacterium sp.]|tara:strand:+ start:299 stop:652 length:354 start_codon:yes stop_codon:yes gene_type:complete
MDVMTTEQNVELSKIVFGSNHMLALMAEIARSEDGRFSTPGLVAATGFPTSTVHTLLMRLKRGGFIRRTGEATSDRVAIYEREIHPTWEYALRLEADADALAAGTYARQWPTEQSSK